jgi:hypothetical protein
MQIALKEWLMKLRSVLWAGMACGLAAAVWLRVAPEAAPAKAPPKVPAALVKAKVDAARRTYEVIWTNNREGLVPFAELAYRWSRRWLEGELDLSDKKADQLAAYQAHRDRMRKLGRITHERYQNRVNTVDEVTAVDFYVAEAEVWVEQAKNP